MERIEGDTLSVYGGAQMISGELVRIGEAINLLRYPRKAVAIINMSNQVVSGALLRISPVPGSMPVLPDPLSAGPESQALQEPPFNSFIAYINLGQLAATSIKYVDIGPVGFRWFDVVALWTDPDGTEDPPEVIAGFTACTL